MHGQLARVGVKQRTRFEDGRSFKRVMNRATVETGEIGREGRINDRSIDLSAMVGAKEEAKGHLRRSLAEYLY